MDAVVADKQSGELAEGHEIAPGRTVLKQLGGGHRYEVYLVWDERLFAVNALRRLIRRGGALPAEQALMPSSRTRAANGRGAAARNRRYWR